MWFYPYLIIKVRLSKNSTNDIIMLRRLYIPYIYYFFVHGAYPTEQLLTLAFSEGSRCTYNNRFDTVVLRLYHLGYKVPQLDTVVNLNKGAKEPCHLSNHK